MLKDIFSLKFLLVSLSVLLLSSCVKMQGIEASSMPQNNLSAVEGQQDKNSLQNELAPSEGNQEEESNEEADNEESENSDAPADDDEGEIENPEPDPGILVRVYAASASQSGKMLACVFTGNSMSTFYGVGSGQITGDYAEFYINEECPSFEHSYACSEFPANETVEAICFIDLCTEAPCGTLEFNKSNPLEIADASDAMLMVAGGEGLGIYEFNWDGDSTIEIPVDRTYIEDNWLPTELLAAKIHTSNLYATVNYGDSQGTFENLDNDGNNDNKLWVACVLEYDGNGAFAFGKEEFEIIKGLEAAEDLGAGSLPSKFGIAPAPEPISKKTKVEVNFGAGLIFSAVEELFSYNWILEKFVYEAEVDGVLSCYVSNEEFQFNEDLPVDATMFYSEPFLHSDWNENNNNLYLTAN